MGSPTNDISSASGAVPVDVSGGDQVVSCRALYIGGTGDVTVDTPHSTNVTFSAVPVGILPVQATKVYQTGTSATDIVALY